MIKIIFLEIIFIVGSFRFRHLSGCL